MERLCRQGNGLFPKPLEIRFSCSCSDSASMCKHVAAVLYGIGSRLDEKPELLFRLRSVDEKDLVANLDPAVPLSKTAPAAGRLLEVEDVSGLFGLDMAGEESPVWSGSDAPTASKPTAKARQARGGGNTGAQKRSSQNPTTVDHTPTEPKRAALKRAIKRHKATQTVARADPIQPPPAVTDSEPARSKTASMRSKVSTRSRPSKPALELTPDGFVKWWK